MKIKFKGLVSLSLSLLIAGSVVTGFPLSSTKTQVNAVSTTTKTTAKSTDKATTSDDDTGLLEDVEGSLILHCFCWNFNTIKSNLQKIADAGYSAIQTSPISRCVVGEGGGMDLYGNGKWYYHYQPTAYTIGNYQLGSEDEFKSMCQEAHKYGIKVIADIVPNHTTTDTGAVDDSLRNISGGLWHSGGGGINYSSRQEVTQKNLQGLPDVNTQNTNVQQAMLKFLKQAVADGCDGFRYDAAKHIELPDDDSSYASNYWDTVLNNGSSFQYGEILEDEYGTARSSAYAKIMHVTASSYGYKLREQITARSLPAAAMSQYYVPGVTDASRLVTWVESHDNYCNDEAGNSWKLIDDTQVRLCWALAAGQGDTTSLFFNRPNGSSKSSQWGNNKIGPTGNDNYCDQEVVAVNKFHNAMSGKDKKLTNVNSNAAVLMISREDAGVIIINDSTSTVDVNTSTSLKDGTYTDYAHNKTFTVSGGKLTGSVGAEQIAVMYTDNVVHNPSVSISYNGTSDGGTFTDTANVTLNASYATASYYQINSGEKVAYTSGTSISLGGDLSEGESVSLTLSATGEEGTTPASKTYTFTKTSKPKIEGKTVVYFDNSQTKWDKVYVYAYTNGGGTSNAQWPGVLMTDVGDDLYGYAIDESWSSAYVLFNNGNGSQYPESVGFTINQGESKIYTNGEWQTYVPTTPTKATTAPTTTQQVTTSPATTAPVVTTTPEPTEATTVAPTTSPATTPQTTYKYGDVNQDGVINITDATKIQKSLAGLTDLSDVAIELAKVSGSSSITVKDATCIRKYILDISTGVGKTGESYNG